MNTHISHVSLIVHNQDEALAFYTEKLGFVVTESHKAPDGTYFWLTVAPTKESTVALSLLLPKEPGDKDIIGKQSGSIPLFILLTDDCHALAQKLNNNGVTFIKQPTAEFWGIDALIKDLYGNIIDICQPAEEKQQ